MVTQETKREIDKLLVREIRVNSDSLLSEVVSIRSALCLAMPDRRNEIVEVFSSLLYSTRDLNEKIKRYERRV